MAHYNLGKLFGAGRLHLQGDTTTEKRPCKITLSVTSHYDERKLCNLHVPSMNRYRLTAVPRLDVHNVLICRQTREFWNLKASLLEDVEKVTRQIDVALVDLVDEKRARA